MFLIKVWTFVVFALLLTSSVFAGETQILSGPIQSLSWTPSFEESFPEDLREKIEASLLFMSNVELSATTPLHDQLFGKNSSPYVDPLKKIQLFKFLEVESPNVFAFALPGAAILKHIGLTSNLQRADLPLIDVASLVLHESRHIPDQLRGNQWRHVNCPEKGIDGDELVSHLSGENLLGRNGCDAHFGGSYAYTAVALYNIGMYCKNCSDKDKQYALFAAEQSLKRVVAEESYDAIRSDWASGQ